MRKWLIPCGGLLCICALLAAFSVLALQPEAAVSATRAAELGLLLLDEDTGLFVLAVTEESPASRAGFMAGDLLLRSQDTALTSAAQLDEMFLRREAAAPLPLTLSRNGALMTLSLPLR